MAVNISLACSWLRLVISILFQLASVTVQSVISILNHQDVLILHLGVYSFCSNVHESFDLTAS
jgi:hypothetical protein